MIERDAALDPEQTGPDGPVVLTAGGTSVSWGGLDVAVVIEGRIRWVELDGEQLRFWHGHQGLGDVALLCDGAMRSRCLTRLQVMALRMDNVGIVVEDLESAIEFFGVLGLQLEGRGLVEGEWAGRVTGLGDQRVEIAMMRTPDGHGRLELSRFIEPQVVADHRNAPVNSLGYLRVMFAVDDIDATLDQVTEHGGHLVSSEVVQYETTYRLCYVRGPEHILIGLAEALPVTDHG